MDTTNQGFDNSKVLIELVLHCTEEYMDPELGDSSSMLQNFRDYKVMLNARIPVL